MTVKDCIVKRNLGMKTVLTLLKIVWDSSIHDVATSLNNLANLYKSQGKYEEAEPLYLQALEMSRQLLGQQHPMWQPASTIWQISTHPKANTNKPNPSIIQALEMKRQLLGQQHPSVATSLNNLAFLYKSQGKYEQAEPLYLQALEMRRQLLGQQHPLCGNQPQQFGITLLFPRQIRRSRTPLPTSIGDETAVTRTAASTMWQPASTIWHYSTNPKANTNKPNPSTNKLWR